MGTSAQPQQQETRAANQILFEAGDWPGDVTDVSPLAGAASSGVPLQVASRTLDGAKLRRHVLRGAVIVFVTAGYSGKRFVFDKAKELGVRTVILDGALSPSCSGQRRSVGARGASGGLTY
jgi:hypothetical protein